MNIIKPSSNNKSIRLTFYIFEIVAVSLLFIQFIIGIYEGAEFKSFLVFLNSFLSGVFNFFILYGIGRVIDLISANKDKDKNEIDSEN